MRVRRMHMHDVELFPDDKACDSAHGEQVNLPAHPNRMHRDPLRSGAFAEGARGLRNQFRTVATFFQSLKKIKGLSFAATPTGSVINVY